MFSVVSCEKHGAPSQVKLLCCMFTGTVGPQTRIIATDVPHFWATWLSELITPLAICNAACVQPYVSCCMADIHGAGRERDCRCIFGLGSTLYGSLTDGSKLQFLSLFSSSDTKARFISLLRKSPLWALLIKYHSSRQWHFRGESCCAECSISTCCVGPKVACGLCPFYIQHWVGEVSRKPATWQFLFLSTVLFWQGWNSLCLETHLFLLFLKQDFRVFDISFNFPVWYRKHKA